MKRNSVLWIFLAVVVFVLAACAPALSPPPEAPQPTGTDIPMPAPLPTEAGAPPAVLPTDSGGAQGGPGVIATAVPSRLPERRLLSLEWPPRIRVGDTDTIRLTLAVDAAGNITPTAEIGGNEIAAEPVLIENLFDTHTIQMEARLNLAGLNVQPQGLQVEQLFPGERVTFYWSVSPGQAGEHRGNLTAQLAMIPKGIGRAERRQILARTLEVESVSVMGMSAGVARWAGFAGSVMGFVFSIPFFETMLGWVFRRIRRVPQV